jgi:LAGLIDADG-like domain/Ribonucleotide reductase alpha domain
LSERKEIELNKPSVRAEVITRRTYNRPLNAEGTKFESWAMTINRVIEHQVWLWERAKGSSLTEEQLSELEDLRVLMLARKVSMSGRVLWLGGTEISKRRESSLFNCSFLNVETVYDMVDILWLLLQGCGVGFKPITGTLNGFMKPIPTIEIRRSTRIAKGGRETNKESFDKETGEWFISVGDSAEAWARSVGKLLAGKHPASKLILSFEEIRPAGDRLAGYGWISSGDAAIAKAYEAIVAILNKRAGCLLTAIDILDVVNWLGTVLSSRRSAEIALMNADDPEWKAFATAKKDFWLHGNEHRCQSNNSLVFYSKPSKVKLTEIFKIMEDAGGSEPGFANGEAALKRAPWFSGLNPCAEILLGNKSFCVSGDTPLITEGALTLIKDTVGKEVLVWNGVRWSAVIPRITGENQKMLRVSFSDGSFLDCTEYHRFSVKNRFDKNFQVVQAKDLLGCGSKYRIHTQPFVIDYSGGVSEPLAYTYGAAYGDGHANKICLYGENKIGLPIAGVKQKTNYRQNKDVPQQVYKLPFNINEFDVADVFLWDRPSILNFLAGLADTDGSTTSTGTVRIYQGDEEFIRVLQLLLTKVGIKSSVNLMAKAGEASNFNRNKAMWYVQITDCAEIPCYRLDTSKGHTSSMKGKNQCVVGVQELDGLHTSYCFTEDEQHMGVFNNTLTYQCNLSEIDIGKFKGDSSGLHLATRLAARANYRQTLVNLKDGVLQESWHLNNEFLRLCGVGLTGIARRPDLSSYDYSELQRVATSAAYSMSQELGTQTPKNICTVKPSGTLSKIMDTTEGVHTPLGKYILNNVNFSKHDPVLGKLKAAGYRVIPSPIDPESTLVTFPVSWEDLEFTTKMSSVGEVQVNDESALDQLERYKMLQVNWTQQNTSVTISYSLSEVPGIINWLLANWDNYVGVSFIYRTDPSKSAKDLGYLYLPQEVTTKAIFDDYVAGLSEVFLDDDDNTFLELTSEECAGGVCPVK